VHHLAVILVHDFLADGEAEPGALALLQAGGVDLHEGLEQPPLVGGRQPWWYNGVTTVLQWRYNGVTMTLRWCYDGVTMVL
jgi:hypothetical protein